MIAPPVVIADSNTGPELWVEDALEFENSTKGPTSLVFAIWLTEPAPPGGVGFDVSTRDGTAVAGTDYLAIGEHASLPEGTNETYVLVPLIDDDEVEGEEWLEIVISNVTGAVQAVAGAVGQIADDDVPRLRVHDAEAPEGGTLTFIVEASDVPTGATISFHASTFDGSALAGVDFVGTTDARFEIPPGTNQLAVEIPAMEDDNVEADESLWLVLSEPTGAEFERAIASGIIVDVPPPVPELSAQDASGTESIGAFEFQVSLSAPAPSGGVGFNYSTNGGSALADQDFAAAFGVGSIPAGATTAVVAVRILDDAWDESEETFALMITGAAGATIVDGNAIGSIVDDDLMHDLHVALTSSGEARRNRELTYTASVHNEGPGPASSTVFELQLPSGGSIVRVSATSEACNVVGNRIECSLGTVDADESFHLEAVFRVTAPKNTVLTSRAMASASGTDATPADDEATLIQTVR